MADSGGATDLRLKDGGPGEGKLWPCTNPGKSCNAHDSCALDPICGKDFLCRASSFQDCDDDLDCTEDVCEGLGKCKNTPKSGYCVLMVPDVSTGTSTQMCVKPGDKNAIHPKDPCLTCDPTQSQTKWSGREGGTCDDQTLCTKDDTCKQGICQGTYYGNACSDGLECTDDICDGKGGCSNKMKSNYCKINGVCYKEAVKDSSGCSMCDPKQDPSAWTAIAGTCKIGLACHLKGAKDTSGCGTCDPTKSTTAWSMASDRCLIDGDCLQKGDKDPSGCGACDPTASQSGWTLVASKCLINGTCFADNAKSTSGCGVCQSKTSTTFWSMAQGSTHSTSGFESGLGGYTASTLANGVGWQTSTKRFHGGKASLYYGSSQAGTYDNGAANKGTVQSASIALTAGKKAALHFWLYLDTETTATYDVLTVSAGGTVLWQKSSTTIPENRYRTWFPVEVDLSSLAGSSVQVTFGFDTKDSFANTGEGVYIDDVSIIHGC